MASNTIPPWIDLFSGDEIVTNCEVQEDGGVKILGSNVTIPCSTYGEVCKKSGDSVATTTYTSDITLSVGDIVYSVRVYSKVLSTDEKAANSAIDMERFGVKEFTLDDSELDGNDYLK